MLTDQRRCETIELAPRAPERALCYDLLAAGEMVEEPECSWQQ
jgi:hypothetical protein